jgi:nitrite reductase (NO-forming)
MPAMNKPVIAGIAAGVLLAGFVVFGPLGQFNFGAQAQSTGSTKKFTLIADEMEVQITPDSHALWPGLKYNAMVFNGTIPGPVISVHQGDTVEITMVNEGDVIHSMDFHSAITTKGANSGPVKAGEEFTWSFEAVNAGVFFYHCSADGLNGVWEHIANGMYGGIVVHPMNEKPAKEFYVVFGQIYSSSTSSNTTGSFDFNKFMAKNPDFVLTNGMIHKYVPAIGGVVTIPLNSDAEIFKVTPGEQTRWYIVNAGPNDGLAFHFIGAAMDVKDGSIKNRYGTQFKNDETWWIPPGSGTVIEAVFPEEGLYVGVDHEMTDVVKGGAFAVLATNDAADDDHPEGTMVMSMEDTMMTQTGGTNATDTDIAANITDTDTNATDTGNETGTNSTG